jgi:hypothetical protein
MNDNTIKLDRNFFMGGNATFTVDNGKGTHYTFKIRQPKKDNPRFTGRAPHFVSLLTGPDNVNSYSYLGMITALEGFKLTKASKMNDASVPVKVLRWVLNLVATNGSMPTGYKVHHEGKCGCCGRALTVPESIERGIGPECWAKLNG